MTTGALDGVRVLDLSHTIGGAFCTRLLAALGADVIKIEPPDTGERLRSLGPWRGDLPDQETGGLHLYLNGGKRSVTLDVGVTSGAVVLKKLLTNADVLVETDAPGALAERGLGYAGLHEAFPRLVYASLSPFGQTGPWRDYQGDGFIAWATGGLAYVTGDPDREPLCNGADPAEYFAGLNLAIAILAALEQREQSGSGQWVETSLFEAVAANTEYTDSLYAFTGAVRRRWYSRHQFRYPSDIMPCQDGHVAVVYGRLGLQQLAVAIDRPDLIDHELFVNSHERFRRWREFEELLRPFLESHTAAEIVAAGQEQHQPFALVPRIGGLLADGHLMERGAFATVDHPAAGPLSYPAEPWKMSATPLTAARAPVTGEHTHEVLTDGATGYDPTDLLTLRERGVT